MFKRENELERRFIMFDKIYELLGKEKVDDLLSHKCTTISKERLKIPSPD